MVDINNADSEPNKIDESIYETPYKCLDCGINFKSRHYLFNHLLHHIKQPKVILERYVPSPPIKLTIKGTKNKGFRVVSPTDIAAKSVKHNSDKTDLQTDTQVEKKQPGSVHSMTYSDSDISESLDLYIQEDIDETDGTISNTEDTNAEERIVTPDEFIMNREHDEIPGGEPTPPPETTELPKIRIKAGLIKTTFTDNHNDNRQEDMLRMSSNAMEKIRTVACLDSNNDLMTNLFTNNDRAKDLGFTTIDPDFNPQDSSALQPFSSAATTILNTNPLATLRDLPMQQLAQQVSRLQPNQNGLHQQNVLINIQQYAQPAPVAPQPYPPQMYQQPQPPPPPPMYHPQMPAPPPNMQPQPMQYQYPNGNTVYFQQAPPPGYPPGHPHAQMQMQQQQHQRSMQQSNNQMHPGQRPPPPVYHRQPQPQSMAGPRPNGQTRPIFMPNHQMQQHRGPPPQRQPRPAGAQQRPTAVSLAQSNRSYNQTIRQRLPIAQTQPQQRQRFTSPVPAHALRPPLRSPSNGNSSSMATLKRISDSNQQNTAQNIKRPRIDTLVPDKNEDADCQVIAVTQKNSGPQIQSVQGNVTDPKSLMQLSDSITVSFTKATSPKPQTEKSSEAKEVADVLASRGITVTTTPKLKEQGDSASEAGSSSGKTSEPIQINLNSSVCIIPKKKEDKVTVDLTDEIDVPAARTARTPEATHSSANQSATDTTMKPPSSAKSKSEQFECHLCPSKFTSTALLTKHRKLYHRTNNAPEFGIPLIDLKVPGVTQRLANFGIFHYIPLPNSNSSGMFALPILSANSLNANKTGNTHELASSILTLGPIKPIAPPRPIVRRGKPPNT